MTSAPPVVPGRDEARRWAAEELAKPAYRDARPGWLEDTWRQFLDWLRSLGGADGVPGADAAVPLLLLTAAVVLAVAVLLVRPRLNARRREGQDVFDADATLSAAVHRQRAAAAAAREDWPTAVVEQFRALVRSAEERAVLDPQPGRTADEAAEQIGRAFGIYSAGLDGAARIFDAVRYGRGSAGARDHADLAEMDAVLAARPPARRTPAPDSPAGPR